MTEEWPFAGRVGAVVAATYPLADSYHTQHLATELPRIVAAANEMVSAETRLELPGNPDVVVVDRRDWVNRNLGSFFELIEPAEQRLAERIALVDDDRARDVARTLMMVETGAVLGFLARRVLGQYELVLPTGESGDSMAFVGANILQMERAQQFRPSEFRMWIALHEAAHRAQFVGVPWMREYFLGLVRELVDSAVPDERRLSTLVKRMRESRRAGKPIVDERGLLGLFASSTQRLALDKVQALMCVLEGHGHVVMDRLGARVLPGQRRMSAVLKARRADQKTALFFRLTGLEMKIRQYEMGERFVMGVQREAGWRAVDAAWAGPEALPTLSEVEDPARWLRRVG